MPSRIQRINPKIITMKKIKINTIDQQKQHSSTKTSTKVSISTIPLPHTTILTVQHTTGFSPNLHTQQDLILQKYVHILRGEQMQKTTNVYQIKLVLVEII